MNKNFSRSNHELESKIICKEEKLKKFITKWTHNVGCDYEDFGGIIEQIGIKLPITISDFGLNSFKCVDTEGKKVEISLYFSDWQGHYSEINIAEGDIIRDKGEVRSYRVNCVYGKGKTLPTVILVKRYIFRETPRYKSLKSTYKEYEYIANVTLEFPYVIEVKVNKIGNNDEKFNTIVNNRIKIEDYLFALENDCEEVSKIYDYIKEIAGLSNDDVFESKRLEVRIYSEDSTEI